MAWTKRKSRRSRPYRSGGGYDYGGWGFPAYVPVSARKAKVDRLVERLKRKGERLDPVRTEGHAIARTFWGKAWCSHLESHSDFSNRLPRGRSYVRNGSVCDLKIEPGRVLARVAGHDLYDVKITIQRLPGRRWAAIRRQCAGGIASLIELLEGRLSAAVMKIITDRKNGLFPRPAEIAMTCSCPDWATMCKHVAATLYGVGARLDDRPELLFLLRGVDHQDLMSERAIGKLIAGKMKTAQAGTRDGAAGTTAEIAESDLAEVFGVDVLLAPPKRKAAAKRGRDRRPNKFRKPAKARDSKPRSRTPARPPRKPKKTSSGR